MESLTLSRETKLELLEKSISESYSDFRNCIEGIYYSRIENEKPVLERYLIYSEEITEEIAKNTINLVSSILVLYKDKTSEIENFQYIELTKKQIIFFKGNNGEIKSFSVKKKEGITNLVYFIQLYIDNIIHYAKNISTEGEKLEAILDHVIFSKILMEHPKATGGIKSLKENEIESLYSIYIEPFKLKNLVITRIRSNQFLSRKKMFQELIKTYTGKEIDYGFIVLREDFQSLTCSNYVIENLEERIFEILWNQETHLQKYLMKIGKDSDLFKLDDNHWILMYMPINNILLFFIDDNKSTLEKIDNKKSEIYNSVSFFFPEFGSF